MYDATGRTQLPGHGAVGKVMQHHDTRYTKGWAIAESPCLLAPGTRDDVNVTPKRNADCQQSVALIQCCKPVSLIGLCNLTQRLSAQPEARQTAIPMAFQ